MVVTSTQIAYTIHILNIKKSFSARQTAVSTKSKKKKVLDDKHQQELKSQLKYELQLYEGLRDRFNKMLSAVRILKSVNNGN